MRTERQVTLRGMPTMKEGGGGGEGGGGEVHWCGQ
jgi:hypothetical protein